MPRGLNLFISVMENQSLPSYQESVEILDSNVLPTALEVAQTTTEPVVEDVPCEPLPEIVFLDLPIYFVCPVCNYKGLTQVERARGCCSSIIYCFSICCKTCDDYQHNCPQCRTVLGSYQVI